MSGDPAIPWTLRTGVAWRDPPDRCGPWGTAHEQQLPGSSGVRSRGGHQLAAGTILLGPAPEALRGLEGAEFLVVLGPEALSAFCVPRGTSPISPCVATGGVTKTFRSSVTG
ncbi:hypothetical protein Q5530_12510 [Saccharothrix sp. BKS2]|uniref:hypothetical protein n=1 Tax=Saccharothrix sp. BKS2 TaxID=3064400 RepID=UPI0039EB828F